MAHDARIRAEDLPVGELIDLGSCHVTREEIVEFARLWDPQPFHTDLEFARDTVFGDVIGSGLHSLAIFQRLAVLHAYSKWAIVAGRGIKDIAFTAPLRPDTTVSASLKIESVNLISDERARVSKTGRVVQGEVQLVSLTIDSYVLRR